MTGAEDAAFAPLEKTYGMIKPDAVRAGAVGEILKAAEDAGFTVVRTMETRLSAERAGEFYAEHRGKPFFDGLVAFMSSGPIVACCFAKQNAILDWRKLMGPTNTFKARDEAPHSLRARFAVCDVLPRTNLVLHARCDRMGRHHLHVDPKKLPYPCPVSHDWPVPPQISCTVSSTSDGAPQSLYALRHSRA